MHTLLVESKLKRVRSTKNPQFGCLSVEERGGEGRRNEEEGTRRGAVGGRFERWVERLAKPEHTLGG